MPINDFANLLGAETIKKIYEDGLSDPTKEVGKILTDFVKTLRLFSAPFQLAANWQDRLQKNLKEVSDRVPADKQIIGQATFVGPLIEQLRFVDEGNYLKKYYLNLLEKAINKDLVSMAHPAFPTIVCQLSPDETLLLEKLKVEDILMTKEYNRDNKRNSVDEVVTKSNFNLEELSFPDLRGMYLDHLQFLDLIRIKSEVPETLIPGKLRFRRTNRFHLSKLGQLFMEACSDAKGSRE